MELLDAMQTMNACRYYKPDPVPDGSPGCSRLRRLPWWVRADARPTVPRWPVGSVEAARRPALPW